MLFSRKKAAKNAEDRNLVHELMSRDPALDSAWEFSISNHQKSCIIIFFSTWLEIDKKTPWKIYLKEFMVTEFIC